MEILCTTDAATNTPEHHAALRTEGWGGGSVHTFRPDAVTDISTEGLAGEHRPSIGGVSGTDVVDYRSFVEALEERRAVFKEMGAVATDHSATTPHTDACLEGEAEGIFARALTRNGER